MDPGFFGGGGGGAKYECGRMYMLAEQADDCMLPCPLYHLLKNLYA